jgi:hypothetical protein
VRYTVIVLAVKLPLALANFRTEVGVGLREAGDVSEKKICPLLFERRISIRICIVEGESGFIPGAGILRFLIPVVLESELERMPTAANR